MLEKLDLQSRDLRPPLSNVRDHLEASEEELIGDEWGKKSLAEHASDHLDSSIFFEIVWSTPSQIEVICQVFDDCCQLQIPVMIVKDKIWLLAHCSSALH